MKLLNLVMVALIGFAGILARAEGHQMQHGFVLAGDDKFASHLVAEGHHSWQVEVTGQLTIEDAQEREVYEARKAANGDGGVYFLLQAQGVDLPTVKAGQVLVGHIIESNVGNYEPKNIIVKNAQFRIEKVLLNLQNPFFGDQ